MRILLLSTTDAGSKRSDALDRMIQSVSAARQTLPDHELHLFILFQNCSEKRMEELRAELPAFVVSDACNRIIPLSCARNVLLRRSDVRERLDTDALVAFPDDDAWYPPNLLAEITERFDRDRELDFWFCKYSSTPVTEKLSTIPAQAAGAATVVRNASSNTIFFRGNIVKIVGEYDEKLGLGTPLGSAEDVDYAFRAYRFARKSIFVDAPLVGHRDKRFDLRGKYYTGSLIVLARFAGRGATGEFLRKIAVGGFLVLRGQLAPLAYGRALLRAIQEMGAPQRSSGLIAEQTAVSNP